MPTDPVIVDTTIVAVGAKVPNYGTILVIGRETGGTAAVNTPMLLSNLTDVATYFGGSTDTYNAAVNLFQQGVAEAYFVKATNTAVPAEAVTKGSVFTLAHPLVAGNPAPVIATYTIEYTDGTPTDPGAGKAMLNPRTGEIWVNGTGSTPMAYSYTDWTNLITAISQQSIALAMIAESPMTFQFYADWYTFINSYLDVYRVIGVAAAGWTGTETVSTILAPITIYSTRHLVAVAHKDTTNDVAAAVIGVLSGIKPWDKLMWKNIDELDMTGYFSKSEVATLEAANVNAIINKSDLDRISDGLTLGVSTLYEYVDIVRTRYYLEGLIIDKLDNLIANTIVQYTAAGINLVKSVVESACQEAVDVGALRVPIEVNGSLSKGYVVEVPTYDSIPLVDKEARILRNVFVTARLPGHIQEIRLNLTLEIGG